MRKDTLSMELVLKLSQQRGVSLGLDEHDLVSCSTGSTGLSEPRQHNVRRHAETPCNTLAII